MNDDYLDLENLINDDSFINWVLYNKNAVVWEEFKNSNPDKQDVILRASQFVREINKVEKVTQIEVNENVLWQRIRSTLGNEVEEPQNPASQYFLNKSWKWAACFALLIGLAFLFKDFYPSKTKTITYKELVSHAEDENLLKEHINERGFPEKILLPDGSIVHLGKQSKLSYPAHFKAKKREVFLSGEAFFEVARDAGKPFYVYANEMVTKVLGTSFEIKAFEDEKKITVSVRTGRVSVYKQARIENTDPEISGLVLLPNQKVTFDRDNENLVKNLVEIPMPLSPLPIAKKERYEDVPVTEIFKILEKVYGVKILFGQEELSDCIITTSLGNESLYYKLDVICKTIGGTFKEIDAQIVIESKGCQ